MSHDYIRTLGELRRFLETSEVVYDDRGNPFDHKEGWVIVRHVKGANVRSKKVCGNAYLAYRKDTKKDTKAEGVEKFTFAEKAEGASKTATHCLRTVVALSQTMAVLGFVFSPVFGPKKRRRLGSPRGW